MGSTPPLAETVPPTEDEGGTTATALDGRTVLVTGGAGFVGSHLVDRLAPRADVRVLDHFSTGRRDHVADGVTVVAGDVRDPETVERAVAGTDVVFHLAAMVSVARSVEDPYESHETNVDGTLQVLEAARRTDARVVLASSAAVYGAPSTVPVPETEPTTPTSPYGVDKLAADHYARVYADLYDLPTVVLRYFNVYGARSDGGDYAGVVTNFLDRARAGEPLLVHGDGEQTRDFVHVSDVVRANLAAATTDRVGEAFNVGTGTSVTIDELAALVREVTGSSSDVVHVEGRTGDVTRSCADVEKARTALGYEARMSLRDGLSRLATRTGGVTGR